MNAWKNAFYISVLLILTLSAGQVGTNTNVSVGLAEHLETKSRILSTLTQKLPKRYTHHAEEISQTIMKQATTHKIDPWMITAVISGESSFNPNAIGPIGEIGLMQLRPRSAEWVAHKMNIKWKGKNALHNPVYNIQIGVAYLGHLKKRFSPQGGHLYLAAYNMGESSLLRLLSKKIEPNVYKLHVMKNYLAINK
jgi:soluble lytic murein transglycosylase